MPAAEAGIPFSDSLYREFRLPPLCGRIVNTPQFQRLGGLRQLGKAHCVFPAAQHTRLEHSIGVAHLTQQLLASLASKAPGGGLEGLELGAREARNVVLAGLCHDLGHGPLSHVFEKEFLRLHGVDHWEHEAMSIRMLEHLVEDNDIEEIDREDIRFMESLIRGAKPEERAALPPARRFVFDIVSNDCNGVDTDRMDYLARDALHCGVGGLRADTAALLRGAKVLDGQVCYPQDQAPNVWAVYADRMRMFRQVYTSRRVKAAEFMAVEALHAAEPVLGLLRWIDTPEDFCSLNDSVLWEVETYRRRRSAEYAALSGEQREALGRAEGIMRRLHRGQHYPCCGEVEVPEALLTTGRWEGGLRREFSAESVAACGSSEAERGLLLRQLIAFENRIDAGKGGRDPMSQVGFYDDSDPSGGSRLLHLSAEQLEGLGRPTCLQERTLRVYVRDAADPDLRRAATRAFAAWCRSHLDARMEEADVMDWQAEEAEAVAAASPLLPAREAAKRAADPRSAPSPAAESLAPPPLQPHTPAGPQVGGGGAPVGRTKRRLSPE